MKQISLIPRKCPPKTLFKHTVPPSPRFLRPSHLHSSKTKKVSLSRTAPSLYNQSMQTQCNSCVQRYEILSHTSGKSIKLVSHNKWTQSGQWKVRPIKKTLPINIAESGPRTKSDDKGIQIQNTISLFWWEAYLTILFSFSR